MVLFSGGILENAIFLDKFSRYYIKKNEAKITNFCKFSDFGFLLISSLIPLSAAISVWAALKLSSKWGRKPVLIIGLLVMLVGDCCLVVPSPAFLLILGLVSVGIGLGFIFQVQQNC